MTSITEEPMIDAGIARLLAPGRVAVIGSTSKEHGVGRRVVRHLEQARFAGEVLVQDPTERLAENVDVAVIAVPAAHAQDVLDRLDGRTRYAVVMSSGFEEVGGTPLRAPEGATLIGPNSVGLYSAGSRFVCTFAQAFNDLVDCPPGAGAFLVSQSGAFGVRIARAARAAEFPLDGFVGTGNETATTTVDVAAAVLADPELRPRVLMLYLETVRDVGALLNLLGDARTVGVPVVVLPGGRTSGGAVAAASHTSALSTDFSLLAESLDWLGARLARTDRELLLAARALAQTRRSSGRRVAVVTGSGGAGVVAADVLEERGLSLPALSPALEAHVASLLPDFASTRNPIDVTAQAVGDTELVAQVCAAIAESGEVDAVLAIGRAAFAQPLRSVTGIPVVVGLLDGIGEEAGGDGVAVTGDLDGAATAIAALTGDDLTQHRSLQIVRPQLRHAHHLFSAVDSMRLFEAADIPVAPWGVASTVDEARAIGERLGWPVVLKTNVDSATHKALAGGVVLDVGPDRIEGEAARLLAASGSILVAVQQRPSLELFAGVREDEQFGLVITAGIGGSHVELLGRTVTVPAGVPTQHLAKRLDDEVFSRGGVRYEHLAGQLADAAARLSRLCGQGYSLVEANPFGAVDGGLMALDARVVTHDE